MSQDNKTACAGDREGILYGAGRCRTASGQHPHWTKGCVKGTCGWRGGWTQGLQRYKCPGTALFGALLALPLLLHHSNRFVTSGRFQTGDSALGTEGSGRASPTRGTHTSWRSPAGGSGNTPPQL